MNLEEMTDEEVRAQTGLSLRRLKEIDAWQEREVAAAALKFLYLGIVHRPDYVNIEQLFADYPDKHWKEWLQENFKDFHRKSAQFGFEWGFHEGFKVGAKEAIDEAEGLVPGLKKRIAVI